MDYHAIMKRRWPRASSLRATSSRAATWFGDNRTTLARFTRRADCASSSWVLQLDMLKSRLQNPAIEMRLLQYAYGEIAADCQLIISTSSRSPND
jgi:hypothetical protein